MSFVEPDLIYQVDNWSPGYLDTPEATRLPIGALAGGANCQFAGLGQGGAGGSQATLAKRSGCILVNPTAIVADQRVDQLYEFRREGVSAGQMLAVCNGGLYLWDGATSFTLLSAAGFNVGAPVEFMTFRNLAFITDGTVSKVYDAASVFSPGFAAPTAAPAIAAVVPAGAGVTGTYQSLATWYDSTHDHESSPSAMGTATAFVAQDRQHTKPAGAPPANVDKWRVYVRRTDTNEVYFKLVAETVVGTATATEAVTDSARNLATNLVAPLPNANDAPPAFAFMCNALGYRFGVQVADSYVWVSAVGDPQSQHPKDKIGIARGDGQQVTTMKAVGTTIVAQKATKTYRLDGDRMPFVPKELNPSLGNKQQSSSVEAASLYWCWDVDKGPYRTDLDTRWDLLADGRIMGILATVNRGAEVRCVHDKANSQVLWAVAVGSSTRLRLVLPYNYLTNSWLPPITGIEYGSFTTFQMTDGTLLLFVGDAWGRVFRYFSGDVEGVPSGTLTADVTAGAAGTVTAGAASFYTTGHGLKGLPVAVVSPSGEWQIRTVQSNTGTVLTLDTITGTDWTTIPTVGYTVAVGVINWYATLPLVDFGLPLRRKRGGHIFAELRAASEHGVTVRGRIDDSTASVSVFDSLLPLSGGAGWGGLWGTLRWGVSQKKAARQRISRCFFSLQVELSNRWPNEPVNIVTLGLTADKLKQWAHGRS